MGFRFSQIRLMLAGLLCLTLLLSTLPVDAVRALPPTQSLSSPRVAPRITDQTIHITGNGFSPAALTLFGPTNVTWVNDTATTQILRSGEPSGLYQIFVPTIRRDADGVYRVARLFLTPETDDFSATLAPGATFTHRFEIAGLYPFYLASNSDFTGQVEIEGSWLTRTNPASGEDGVAVTRETVVEFSGLLDATTVTSQTISATFGGHPLPTRLQLSADRRRVTLFYTDNLPPSARIQVALDGDNLRDDAGLAVDVDNDNVAGGRALIEFSTLGLAVVANTSVCGRVFASELVTGASGASINSALANVKITVDGMEGSLFTFTDGGGNFCLDPAPAGRFFVHVDGRTTTNPLPIGAYYPFVGKAWTSRPGQQTDVGDVYLPLVSPGTLQPVSQNADTEIHFSQTVLERFPEFANVQVVVPANSLYADDGTVGGQVGIAPVPPDRLPGTLPDYLEFPVVITVQTDGATNFDTPAPVCFPNLPNPKSGQPLPPNAKSALHSFNHDTGAWEVIGPMTVSTDGAMICTDPGVGVRAPGWHGSDPGVDGDDGGGEEEDDNCDLLETQLKNAMADCLLALLMAIPESIPAYGCAIGFAVGALASARDCNLDSGSCGSTILNNALAAALGCIPVIGGPASAAFTCLNALTGPYQDFLDQCLDGRSRQQLAVNTGNIVTQQRDLFSQAGEIYAIVFGDPAWGNIDPVDQAVAEDILRAVRDGLAASSDGGSRISEAEKAAVVALPRPALISQQQVEALVVRLDRMNANELSKEEIGVDAYTTVVQQFDSTVQALEDAGWQSTYDGILNTVTGANPAGGASRKGLAAPFFYRLTNSTTGFVRRGQMSDQGTFVNLILAPNSLYIVEYLHPTDLRLARAAFRTGAAGSRISIPRGVLRRDSGPDTDNDGLTDKAEAVIGTNPGLPDTDGDGILDGAEIQQGTNPLDNLPVTPGVLASVDTPGTAVGVCITGDIAAVADSAAGVAFFNIFNGMNPTAVGQVDTPGNAVAVACGEDFVAVADQSKGLAILDLTNPADPSLRHQIDLQESVSAVGVARGLIYAGTGAGLLAVVHPVSGEILQRVQLPDPIHDLALVSDVLYVLTSSKLYSFSSYDRGLFELSMLEVGGSPSPLEVGRKLFAGPETAYVGHFSGFTTVDVRDPYALALIAAPPQTQAAVHDIALNGSGRALLTTSFAGANTLAVSVYDVSDPADVTRFETSLNTPGQPRSLVIHNGLAYVADQVGLQVLNYLGYDTQAVAPSVESVQTNFVPGLAQSGVPMRVTVEVADDVQVREVAFVVNGEPAAVDVSYPFQQEVIVPALLAASTVQLQARATDTGGNSARQTVDLTLVPDAAYPEVIRVSPTRGSTVGNVTTTVISATFSEAMNGGTLTASSFQLFAAGPDGLPGNGDDVPINQGTIGYDAQSQTATFALATPLPLGTYRAVVSTGATDLAGNHLQKEVDWTFALAEFIPFDQEIQGSISFADEVQVYYFSTDPGQMLYFDEIGSTKFYWKVENSLGQKVFDAQLSESPTFYNYDVGVYTMAEGGTYVLSVYNVRGETGDYSFRIWTIPAPDLIPLELDQTVSDGIPQAGAGHIEHTGGRDIYTFSAPPNQRVYFDVISGIDLSYYWSVVDSAGTVVFKDRLYIDPGVQTLSLGGPYTMTVESTVTPVTHTYSVRVWTLPEDQNFDISVGQTISNGVPGPGAGNIELPGLYDNYFFTAALKERVFFDIQDGGTSQNRWRLTDTTGTEVFNQQLLEVGTQELVQGGAYTLSVGTRTNSYTGTYQFTLWPVAQPDEFQISVGDLISDGMPQAGAGNIESPGVLDQYHFTASPGQDIFLDIQEGATANLRWKLVDQSGVQLLSRLLNTDTGPYDLTLGGPYTLTVGQETNDYIGDYQLQIWDVPPPDSFDIAVGAVISEGVPGPGAGRIESPAVRDVYRFNAAPGQSVFLDLQEGANPNFRWFLTDSTGATLVNRLLNTDAGTAQLTQGGIYTLTIGADTQNTGAYRIQLWDVPPTQSFVIAMGDVVSDGVPAAGSGNIESPGVLDLYTFSGAANQMVDFHILSGATANTNWLLKDPDGVQIFNRLMNSDFNRIILPKDGTYTLTVGNPSRDYTGVYSFQIVLAP